MITARFWNTINKSYRNKIRRLTRPLTGRDNVCFSLRPKMHHSSSPIKFSYRTFFQSFGSSKWRFKTFETFRSSGQPACLVKVKGGWCFFNPRPTSPFKCSGMISLTSLAQPGSSGMFISTYTRSASVLGLQWLVFWWCFFPTHPIGPYLPEKSTPTSIRYLVPKIIDL